MAVVALALHLNTKDNTISSKGENMHELNEALELPASVAGWLAEYNRIKAEIKMLTEKADIARAHVELALGDSTMATVNGVPVLKYDYVESNRLDQKKVKNFLTEEALEQCMTVQVARVFRPISQDDM